jgi:large subunit ribosomal protein L21
MLAVIELWGNQFTVQQWDQIDVKRLDLDEWVTSNTGALLISDADWKDTKVGTPIIEKSKVEFKVIEQYKWEKVRVFKKKSKKRYTRNVGFRPHLTKIEILSIA